MIEINKVIISTLIREQFPQWAGLQIKPVPKSGHDNRTYLLGDEMTVRLPSSEAYVPQVEKEYRWLPVLKKFVSLPISCPIAKGLPGAGYPFPWLVNRFIQGENASYENIGSLDVFAADLALFLKEFKSADTAGAPLAGPHNFYRGGDLGVYHEETEQALDELKGILPTDKLQSLWDKAISAKWYGKDVWIHGDVAPGNLLVQDGRLCGVIDFGIMGVGDPSCDYAMAWTFFDKKSRKTFLDVLECDNKTADRARGWALWKALITYRDFDQERSALARHTIRTILEEC